MLHPFFEYILLFMYYILSLNVSWINGRPVVSAIQYFQYNQALCFQKY